GCYIRCSICYRSIGVARPVGRVAKRQEAAPQLLNRRLRVEFIEVPVPLAKEGNLQPAIQRLWSGFLWPAATRPGPGHRTDTACIRQGGAACLACPKNC